MNFVRIKRGVKRKTIDSVISIHNGFTRLFNQTRQIKFSELEPLKEIQKKSLNQNDICDHLPTLFAEVVKAQPKLIVELGVRGGESTFVFQRAAKYTKANLLSVDMNDCKDVSSDPQWNFIQSDDIIFAQKFPAFCAEKTWSPKIDVLFIDTSHEYQHTVQEINSWFPFLSEHGMVIFHDTNLREIYRRKNFTWGHGWDNQRGVIRAIEEYFKRSWNESSDFVDVLDGWVITHAANCSGLTILQKTT